MEKKSLRLWYTSPAPTDGDGIVRRTKTLSLRAGEVLTLTP